MSRLIKENTWSGLVSSRKAKQEDAPSNHSIRIPSQIEWEAPDNAAKMRDRDLAFIHKLVKEARRLEPLEDGYYHLTFGPPIPLSESPPPYLEYIEAKEQKNDYEKPYKKFVARMVSAKLLDEIPYDKEGRNLRIYPRLKNDGQTMVIRMSPKELERLQNSIKQNSLLSRQLDNSVPGLN